VNRYSTRPSLFFNRIKQDPGTLLGKKNPVLHYSQAQLGRRKGRAKKKWTRPGQPSQKKGVNLYTHIVDMDTTQFFFEEEEGLIKFPCSTVYWTVNYVWLSTYLASAKWCTSFSCRNFRRQLLLHNSFFCIALFRVAWRRTTTSHPSSELVTIARNMPNVYFLWVNFKGRRKRIVFGK
jgi:hypothetical protein